MLCWLLLERKIAPPQLITPRRRAFSRRCHGMFLAGCLFRMAAVIGWTAGTRSAEAYRSFHSFLYRVWSVALRCLQFLNGWVQKIRALGVGQLAMAPCGWVRADGTGHAVVFVVMRQTAEFFSVTIVNPCGEGTEYHAQEADPAKGKVSKRWSTVAVTTHVERRRAQFMMF